MTKILYAVGQRRQHLYAITALKRKNFDLVIARDGQAGVEAAQRENPDIILMDLSLPVLDGWGATRKLKSDASTKDIPIIALSAHAMEEHKSSAIEAGCNDYDTNQLICSIDVKN